MTSSVAGVRALWLPVLVVVFASACSSSDAGGTLDSTTVAQTGERFDAADLVTAVGGLGVGAVDLGESAPGDPFGVAAQLVCVNGHVVRFHEYESVAEREAVSGTISPDGWSAVDGPYEWVAAPSFWVRDNAMVFTLGADQATRDALTAVLGPRVAGSDTPAPRDERAAERLSCEI